MKPKPKSSTNPERKAAGTPKAFWISCGKTTTNNTVFAHGKRVGFNDVGWAKHFETYFCREGFERITGIKLAPGEQRKFVLKEVPK